MDSYVRVAPDSTGKYIRNAALWLPIDLLDGVGPQTVLVQQQVTIPADPLSGKLIDSDLKPTLCALLDIATEQRDLMSMLAGASSGGLGGGTSEPVLAQPISGLQPAGDPSGPVRTLSDKFGRQITVPWGSRDMFGTGFSGTITTTSVTTLVAAQPNIYSDLAALIITNTSASTSARADVSDGTNTYAFESIGGAPSVGFAGGGFILPAANKNTAWTITMSGAVTDIRAWAIFIKNK